MAMNREMKRQLQRQGDDADDETADALAGRSRVAAPRAPAAKSAERDVWVLSPQGLREVRAEMRKVAWPTRQETINYSMVVLVTLVVLTLLIFGIDWVISKAVLKIFES